MALLMCSRGMLSRLRGLTEADVMSGNVMHETMLAAMCRWGRGTDVLDLVISWGYFNYFQHSGGLVVTTLTLHLLAVARDYLC